MARMSLLSQMRRKDLTRLRGSIRRPARVVNTSPAEGYCAVCSPNHWRWDCSNNTYLVFLYEQK